MDYVEKVRTWITERYGPALTKHHNGEVPTSQEVFDKTGLRIYAPRDQLLEEQRYYRMTFGKFHFFWKTRAVNENGEVYKLEILVAEDRYHGYYTFIRGLQEMEAELDYADGQRGKIEALQCQIDTLRDAQTQLEASN